MEKFIQSKPADHRQPAPVRLPLQQQHLQVQKLEPPLSLRSESSGNNSAAAGVAANAVDSAKGSAGFGSETSGDDCAQPMQTETQPAPKSVADRGTKRARPPTGIVAPCLRK